MWSNSVCTGVSPNTDSDNHFFYRHLRFLCPSCLNFPIEKGEELYLFWFRSVKQLAYYSVPLGIFCSLLQ